MDLASFSLRLTIQNYSTGFDAQRHVRSLGQVTQNWFSNPGPFYPNWSWALAVFSWPTAFSL
jgi:hypothetical protein